jgi:hypothetical protein
VNLLAAQRVDPRLERVVEHVADHRHATSHPLPGSTELGDVELSHGPAAGVHGEQHCPHRLAGKAVAPGNVADGVFGVGSDCCLRHCRSFVVGTSSRLRNIRGPEEGTTATRSFRRT